MMCVSSVRFKHIPSQPEVCSNIPPSFSQTLLVFFRRFLAVLVCTSASASGSAFCTTAGAGQKATPSRRCFRYTDDTCFLVAVLCSRTCLSRPADAMRGSEGWRARHLTDPVEPLRAPAIFPALRSRTSICPAALAIHARLPAKINHLSQHKISRAFRRVPHNVIGHPQHVLYASIAAVKVSRRSIRLKHKVSTDNAPFASGARAVMRVSPKLRSSTGRLPCLTSYSLSLCFAVPANTCKGPPAKTRIAHFCLLCQTPSSRCMPITTGSSGSPLQLQTQG